MLEESARSQSDSNGRLLAWLKEFFNSRIEYERQIVDERDKRYMTLFSNSEKAVVIALESVNRRLDLLNESRSVISDMVANNPTRVEIQTGFDNVSKELKNINARLDRGEGIGSGKSVVLSYVFGTIGIFAAIATVIFKLISK